MFVACLSPLESCNSLLCLIDVLYTFLEIQNAPPPPKKILTLLEAFERVHIYMFIEVYKINIIC